MVGRLDDLNRVEPTKEEKAAAHEEAAREAEAKPERLAAEGYGLYFGGKPPEACLVEKPYGGYAAAQDGILRLCGYVGAMREDMKVLRKLRP